MLIQQLSESQASALSWHLLWSYRVLRSLKENKTGGQLLHQPFYQLFFTLDQGQMFLPSILGADHIFEWQSAIYHFPLIVVLISINLLLHYTSPKSWSLTIWCTGALAFTSLTGTVNSTSLKQPVSHSNIWEKRSTRISLTLSCN